MGSSKSNNRRGGGTGSSGHHQPNPQGTAPGNYETDAEQGQHYDQASLELDRVGDILRQVREQRGENLEDISEYLRIRPSYLHAIEGSKYGELPADAYVIGFLRSYANYLGLDGRAAIDQYRKEMAGRRNKPRLSMPQPLTEGQMPSMAVMLVAFVGMFFIYILWYSLSGPDNSEIAEQIILPQTATLSQTTEIEGANINAETSDGVMITTASPAPADVSSTATAETAPPQTQTLAQTATASAASSAPATTTQTKDKPQEQKPAQQPAESAPKPAAPAAEQPKNGIIIRAEKESWVLIVNSEGETVLDKVFKPGEAYAVISPKGLKLTTGNAAGVIISLDGTDLPHLGEESQVIRGISLDPDKLKDLLSKQQ